MSAAVLESCLWCYDLDQESSRTVQKSFESLFLSRGGRYSCLNSGSSFLTNIVLKLYLIEAYLPCNETKI